MDLAPWPSFCRTSNLFRVHIPAISWPVIKINCSQAIVCASEWWLRVERNRSFTREIAEAVDYCKCDPRPTCSWRELSRMNVTISSACMRVTSPWNVVGPTRTIIWACAIFFPVSIVVVIWHKIQLIWKPFVLVYCLGNGRFLIMEVK